MVVNDVCSLLQLLERGKSVPFAGNLIFQPAKNSNREKRLNTQRSLAPHGKEIPANFRYLRFCDKQNESFSIFFQFFWERKLSARDRSACGGADTELRRRARPTGRKEWKGHYLLDKFKNLNIRLLLQRRNALKCAHTCCKPIFWFSQSTRLQKAVAIMSVNAEETASQGREPNYSYFFLCSLVVFCCRFHFVLLGSDRSKRAGYTLHVDDCRRCIIFI